MKWGKEDFILQFTKVQLQKLRESITADFVLRTNLWGDRICGVTEGQ